MTLPLALSLPLATTALEPLKRLPKQVSTPSAISPQSTYLQRRRRAHPSGARLPPLPRPAAAAAIVILMLPHRVVLIQMLVLQLPMASLQRAQRA